MPLTELAGKRGSSFRFGVVSRTLLTSGRAGLGAALAPLERRASSATEDGVSAEHCRAALSLPLAQGLICRGRLRSSSQCGELRRPPSSVSSRSGTAAACASMQVAAPNQGRRGRAQAGATSDGLQRGGLRPTLRCRASLRPLYNFIPRSRFARSRAPAMRKPRSPPLNMKRIP